MSDFGNSAIFAQPPSRTDAQPWGSITSWSGSDQQPATPTPSLKMANHNSSGNVQTAQLSALGEMANYHQVVFRQNPWSNHQTMVNHKTTYDLKTAQLSALVAMPTADSTQTPL